MKIVEFKTWLLIFYLFSASCKDSSFDGAVIGEKYCRCMEANNLRSDYYNARIICDSKLALENRFFRINYIESLYGNGYMRTLDKDTRDSVNDFTYRFTIYISEHCPYVYYSDSIRREYLKRMK